MRKVQHHVAENTSSPCLIIISTFVHYIILDVLRSHFIHRPVLKSVNTVLELSFT
jgi:hypothetical protein